MAAMSIAVFLGWGLSMWSANALRKGSRIQSNQTADDCYSVYDGQHLLSLAPCTPSMVADMVEMLAAEGCYVLSDEGIRLPKTGCAQDDAICSATSADAMEGKFGQYVRTLTEDAGGHFRLSSGAPEHFAAEFGTLDAEKFYTNWRGLEEQEARVQQAVAASGGVAKLDVLGKSVEGRLIRAVRLTGSGYVPGGPKLFFNFNLHAREWISGMAGVYAVEKMVARAQADPSWLEGKELVLVPMSNPDGFDYSNKKDRFWRKNRQPKTGGWFSCDGVDLNRNFPKDFGGSGSTSKNSCSDTFIGKGALSEPESQALAKVINEAPLTVHIDVHAFSQLILAAWSYQSGPHPRKAEIFDLGNKMQAAMLSKNSMTYEMGDNLLYEASGVFGDYSSDKGALGFTYELRPKSGGRQGFAPPPSLIQPTAEECLEGLYAAIAWVQ